MGTATTPCLRHAGGRVACSRAHPGRGRAGGHGDRDRAVLSLTIVIVGGRTYRTMKRAPRGARYRPVRGRNPAAPRAAAGWVQGGRARENAPTSPATRPNYIACMLISVQP